MQDASIIERPDPRACISFVEMGNFTYLVRDMAEPLPEVSLIIPYTFTIVAYLLIDAERL